MKFDKKVFTAALAGSLLAQASQSFGNTDTKNPYGRIVTRNAFGLREPDPVPENKPVVAPPSKVLLQGITTILGRKQVLMKIQPPATPGTPAKELSIILSENQREGDVEVITINELSGSIKLLNAGIEQTLTLEKDAAKPSGASVPVNIVAGALPQPMAMPTAVPSPVPTAPVTAAKGFKTAQSRNVRTSGGYGLSSANSGANSSANQLSDRATMSLEEQTIMMEAQRVITKDAVQAGEMPPLPPTDATHLLAPPAPSPTPNNP